MNLIELLTRLLKYGLRLNGKKCVLGGDEVDFVGMTVNEIGIKHLDSRKQAMKDLSLPRTKKQLKSFLGMCGYFRDPSPGTGQTRVFSETGGFGFFETRWVWVCLALKPVGFGFGAL